MTSNRSLSEEEHLKEIVSLLAANGRDYLACQVAHLASILKGGAQSLLPILRWGYLLAKGHLSKREAVSLLTALYAEARSAASGGSGGKLLSLLAQSRDGAWLAERFREEIAREEENRKTNLTYRGELGERLQGGEAHHEEMAVETPEGGEGSQPLPHDPEEVALNEQLTAYWWLLSASGLPVERVAFCVLLKLKGQRSSGTLRKGVGRRWRNTGRSFT